MLSLSLSLYIYICIYSHCGGDEIADVLGKYAVLSCKFLRAQLKKGSYFS